MSTPAPSRKSDRIRARRDQFVAWGYSAGVAGALAHIEQEDVRAAIATRTADLGVKDGPARAYAVRLVAHNLKAGDPPSAPARLSGPDAAYVQARANALAGELRAGIAAARKAAEQEREDAERKRRHDEALEQELTR